MLQNLTFRITGVVPLLMHNGRLANPLDQITKAIKKISSKRDKTDADFEEMARLEWLGGLYLQGGEPCLPGEIIEAALIEAGRKKRKGKQVTAGVFCDGNFALEYDDPRNPEALFEDPRFRFTVGARVQRNRVMRTRPRFHEWAATITVTYNDELLNATDIHELLVLTGEIIGLGDWRPKFGRFVVEKSQ
jgi:hypothetical protein